MAQFELNVRILKDRNSVLGTGSYGSVYKARCDDLFLCAAKVLHAAFFQSDDPHSGQVLRRFQQECDLLKEIRHPNIVQFLGKCEDPESKLPVLLMELLDESLTRFLERSATILPLCTQVNFSHDIAQAVAYLHSKEIIHRDLSSNNVLVIAGSRAKVTDFGMSRILGPTHDRRLTSIPGTEVYMPPESLPSPADYTSKLDCFSLGPLMIQIITKEFPDPTAHTERIEDPKSPTRTALRPVLESIRRESHLKLVSDVHPLKRTIDQCISYDPEFRPSALEICHQLEEIKESELYITSQMECITTSTAQDHDIVGKLTWEDGINAPRTNITPGSIAVDNMDIYIQPYNTTKIYTFKINKRRWSEPQDCQKTNTSLVVVNKLLTAIGGYLGSEEFDTLTSLTITDGVPQWIEVLPRMPTKRYNTSVAQSNNLVIVTGGLGNDQFLNKVEILDTASDPKLWFVASSLPTVLSRHSSAVCSNQIYLFKGIGCKLDKASDVIHCNLNTLLLNSECAASTFVTAPSNAQNLASSPWRISSTLPVYYSACSTLRGRLIAIGGVNPTNKTTQTRNVYAYDNKSDTWSVCSEMKIPRSMCLAAVLQDSKIVAIGGKSGDLYPDSISVASAK